MKGVSTKVRLIVLVSFGLLAALLARPVMEQVMLMQESQKASTNVPPPEKTVSMDPAQALGSFSSPGKSSKGEEKTAKEDESEK